MPVSAKMHHRCTELVRFEHFCKLLNSQVPNCMSFVISSLMPFPNIFWWSKVVNEATVIWDHTERFRKMSYRNRYYIAGANGLILLSIPVVNGRDQRASMEQISISYGEAWQRQHWRTLFSAYNRSPFFEYYAPSLEQLFLTKFNKLSEFNLASVHWVRDQLKLPFIEETSPAQTTKDGTDLRRMMPGSELSEKTRFPVYQQVFAGRTGFIPNLSILDLLFAEGPGTLPWIREHASEIEVMFNNCR